MAPLPIAPPSYGGPKALGFSKYASPAQQHAQLAAASSFPATASSTTDNTIVTKQQVAALIPGHGIAPPAAELAVEQGTALKKEVQDHTAKYSRAVSNAIVNTRQLLTLIREAKPGSKVVDDLWQELEQLFKAVSKAKTALPEFMEKQRDNMSLYHSSMMNETIRETQEELNLQHKKVNTQHNLILEQQDAFQNYKQQTVSKLKELEGLQERVSRLTLEKGNFRTEVDKYKDLLEQETARKTEDLATADALQKELETLISSKKQLEADNKALRKTTTEMLEQLKSTEQKVKERFSAELAAKAEEAQKESAKAVSLTTLINTLKSDEKATKKELDKIRNENRLLSVKYTNQAAEHAAAFSKTNDQAKQIEALMVKVNRLQEQNVDLHPKMESATELRKANTELVKDKEAMTKQMDNLASQLKKAIDEAEVSRAEMQKLNLELAANATALSSSTDKASLEKLKASEEKSRGLEATLAEWQELAKRSYKEYKDTLVKLQEAEKRQQGAVEKDMQIADLRKQLAAAKALSSNGADPGEGSDSAYWKQKYDSLLSSL